MWGAASQTAPGAALVVGRDDSARQTTYRPIAFCCVKGRERRSKTISLPCWKKKRSLESKEKGAPKGVRWLQIVIRRLGFTPPLWTSPVYGRLPGRNRDKPWSYPNFFRRLRGWGSGRGDAARYSLFTLHYSLLLFFVGRDDPGAPKHAAESGRSGYYPPAALPFSEKTEAGAADGSARLASLIWLAHRYRANAPVLRPQWERSQSSFWSFFLQEKGHQHRP